METFPPKVPLDYLCPPAPIDSGYGKFDRYDYFQSHRNELLSRIHVSNNTQLERYYHPLILFKNE